jgi:hypothetical protein
MGQEITAAEKKSIAIRGNEKPINHDRLTEALEREPALRDAALEQVPNAKNLASNNNGPHSSRMARRMD